MTLPILPAIATLLNTLYKVIFCFYIFFEPLLGTKALLRFLLASFRRSCRLLFTGSEYASPYEFNNIIV